MPKEATNFEEKQNKLQEQYEEYQDELYDKVVEYIMTLLEELYRIVKTAKIGSENNAKK